MLRQEPKERSHKENRHGASGAFLTGKVPYTENSEMQTAPEVKTKLGKLFL